MGYQFRVLGRAAFLLGLICLTVPGSAHAQKGPPRAVPVVTAVAEERMIAPTVWVPGVVVSQDDAEMAAEVAGRLISIAEVGQRVRRGDAVARLDAALIRAQVAEGEATIRREQANLEYMEREAGRLKQLAARESIAKSELDKAQADRQVARSNLEAAKARLRLDKERLARHVIRASFDGVVTERLRRSGEWAGAGEAVVRIANDKALEIEARVPGSAVAHLRMQEMLAVQREGDSVQAMVKAIVPVGDRLSHLFEVRLALSGEGWRAGQAVRVAVPSDAARRVLAVPRDALVLRRTGIAVFRVNGEGVAERVEITTGVASGAMIEVQGPLKAGDKVVVRGGERLRPGQAVNAIPAGAEP